MHTEDHPQTIYRYTLFYFILSIYLFICFCLMNKNSLKKTF